MLLSNKEHLKSLNDVVSVLEFMKETKYDIDSLLNLAFSTFVLDENRIADLRNSEKLKTIQELVNRNQENATHDLKRKTKCKCKTEQI